MESKYYCESKLKDGYYVYESNLVNAGSSPKKMDVTVQGYEGNSPIPETVLNNSKK